jgi:hypothetical protein
MVVSIVLDIRSKRLFSITDMLFWLSLAFCLVLSYVDVAHLNRQFTPAQAPRVRAWWRVAFAIVALSLVAWGSAHLIAWLVGGMKA